MSAWLKSIQAVLVSRKTDVAYGKVWQEIHRELGVGAPSGRRLLLSPEDVETLAQEYRLQTGGASLGADLRGDRTAVAAVANDEKVSSGGVFSRHLRLSSADGVIHYQRADGEVVACALPPNSYLALSPDTPLAICPRHYDRVLVVENGNLMENIDALKTVLPVSYRSRTLYLYRGHDQAMRHVYRLVQSLSPHITLGVFCDYDPAGVRIAMNEYFRDSRQPLELLVPETSEAVRQRYNKTSLHYAQADLLLDMLGKRDAYAPVMAVAEAIQQGRWALSQEGMLAHGIPVYAIPITLTA